MTRSIATPDLGLDWLLERCREEDGCLIWTLRVHEGRPVATVEQHNWQVRRLVWLLARRPFIRPGHYPAMTCVSEGCVHPDHMEECRRNDHCRDRKVSVLTKSRMASAARASTALPQAAVDEIRNSTETLTALGARFGITKSWASKIRAGVGRRDFTAVFGQHAGVL